MLSGLWAIFLRLNLESQVDQLISTKQGLFYCMWGVVRAAEFLACQLISDIVFFNYPWWSYSIRINVDIFYTKGYFRSGYRFLIDVILFHSNDYVLIWLNNPYQIHWVNSCSLIFELWSGLLDYTTSVTPYEQGKIPRKKLQFDDNY